MIYIFSRKDVKNTYNFNSNRTLLNCDKFILLRKKIIRRVIKVLSNSMTAELECPFNQSVNQLLLIFDDSRTSVYDSMFTRYRPKNGAHLVKHQDLYLLETINLAPFQIFLHACLRFLNQFSLIMSSLISFFYLPCQLLLVGSFIA